jgi:hypothetical protein
LGKESLPGQLRVGARGKKEMFNFSLNSSIFEPFNQAAQLLFERKATLVFPEKREECPNCYLNTFGTKTRSVSIYKQGGPYPFDDGMPCPYCEGKGYKQVELSETIPIQILWEVQSYYKKMLPIEIQQGSIQTIARSIYAPKLEMAKYLIPNDGGIENLDIKKYERLTPMYPLGFKDNPVKYMVHFWKQNGS